MNIVYEDPDLVLCEKPAGILSEEGGMPELLRKALGTRDIFCVHRLDRETGGLMVYARSGEAAAELSSVIAKGALHKEYWAVVEGEAPEEGVLRDLLFRDAHRNKSYVVQRKRKGVREAELSFRREAFRDGLSLLRVRLKTGRSHQIRVQFASRKLPLAGDRKYGSDRRDCGLALWSAFLSFPHPRDGREISRELPPPQLWPWTLFSDLLYPEPGTERQAGGNCPMRYIEVIVDTPAEAIDRRCEEMTAMGVGGFVIENEEDFRDFLEHNHAYWDYVDQELELKYLGISRIKCYLTDDGDGRECLRRIQAAYGPVAVSYVQDSDWENNWRQYYMPIEVGEKLVVVPEWEPIPENGRIPLRLDPGLIFGTGSHATTRLCLAALERYVNQGARVLDLGCGSGILGIGALVLGAQSCLGCDIDPKAPDVVRANAALNGIGPDQLQVCAGDILSDASLRRSFGSGYDLVLSNIVSDVIIPLSQYVRAFLAPGGVWISSGIIEGRQNEVRAAIEQAGFTILEHNCEDEWHSFTAK